MTLRRKTSIRRSSTLSRSSGIAKKNAKRSAKNHERAYGEKAEWIRQRACHNCGKGPDSTRRIAAAHIKNGGMGRKSDAAFLIPLCETENRRGCHDDQHQHGWAFLFWLKTPEERENAAAHYEAEFQAHCASRRTTET